MGLACWQVNPDVGVVSVGEAQTACGLDSLRVFEFFGLLDFIAHHCIFWGVHDGY